jgi:hypothetical protein
VLAICSAGVLSFVGQMQRVGGCSRVFGQAELGEFEHRWVSGGRSPAGSTAVLQSADALRSSALFVCVVSLNQSTVPATLQMVVVTILKA